MKRMRYLYSAILVLALSFGSYINASAQNEITLMAMGPGRRPTEKNIANFQAKTGYRVKVAYVNGVETRQLVAKGQPLDVNLIVAPFPAAVASRTLSSNARSRRTTASNHSLSCSIPAGIRSPGQVLSARRHLE